MKTLKTLLILTFVTFVTFSCDKDDDSTDANETQIEANIIGTWVWTSSTVDGQNDPLIECDNLFTMVFTSSQITQTDYYGSNCQESESYTESYSINGNSLSITDDNQAYILEIVTLNSSTLTLKETEENSVYTETYTKQ